MADETSGLIEQGLQRLRQVGSPDEMWREAARGLAPAGRPAINAHIHLPPNFSAFESIEQAVKLAARQNVRLLGASNYYEYSIYALFLALALDCGIYPLFGLEIICLLDDAKRAGIRINDPANPGRMYLCGKGMTRFGKMTAEAARLLGRMRRQEEQRIRRMTRLLSDIFERRGVSVRLDDTKIVDRIVRRLGVERDRITLQERHVAQAFQEEFFRLVPEHARPAELGRILGVPAGAAPCDSSKVQNEIRNRLMKAGKPAFVEESFLNFAEAYRLILELGGIPCYPTLADGTSPVCAYEDPPEKLAGTLASHGIHCAEFIPLRNEPEVLREYVETVRSAGFVVTAGTEHNTLGQVSMEPACLGGLPVAAGVKDIFLEGAYVIAAHQFLLLHGQCGYVDDRGNLNPAFRSGEDRITHFRRLGAAVVARQLADKSL